MPTHNLKLPKNYRDTSSDFYIKAGIGLIALLLVLNLILLTLFIKETKNSGRALLILQETSRSLVLLQDSLGRMDMQKALVHLADARRQIAAALPPAPVAPPAKTVTEPPPVKTVAESKGEPVKPPAVEQKPAAVSVKPPPVEQKPAAVSVKPPAVEQKPAAISVKPVQLSIPAGEMPAPLGLAVPGEYALICEKESKLLHLLKFQDERFALVKSYPCIIGANGTNKKKAGDYATPKGSYFTLRYTPGSALQEIYGEGAFVLNYPNFLDRKERKNGGGIWIHGHVPGKVVGVGDLLNTKGCIAVSNDIIRELKNLLHPSGTNVSIVDKVTFVKEGSRRESLQEIRNVMDAWRQAWESGNTEKYLRYFSKDFINGEGMNFAAFKRHKERVNSGKKFIRVKVEQMAIVFPQEQQRETAAVRFVQKYSSSNFESHSKKLFYLKKENEGWTIFGESFF
ncbi:MAG: L,D-transpeptidase family protein [Deltaproteobacteria bacterium]|nr:L,D-transpeptidase family protein [Deltaproteobacteria bacterium]